MRLIKTSVAAVAVLAVSGTALAASTRDEVTATMGGTHRIASGGKVKLIVQHRTGGKRFRVVIRYDVTVTSKTVLSFAVYPCKDTSCINQSTSRIALSARSHHVRFTGKVPVVMTGKKACVFAQIRDQGPNGKLPGKVVHKGKLKGIAFCRKVA
jgi:hypothetical protein